ncbi:MAG: response regulator transcription factor [Chitinophagaceae bacterium]|nr:response regulator transcription factor [Chitinophagaceae bacterium]
MKFPAILVDDEKRNISFLQKLLNLYCPDVEVVATATNVQDAAMQINKMKPVLLFLDIELHDKTGFDLLTLIDDYPVEVILVSAHDKYAFKAFKFEVLDYILKPVSIEELIAAVKRAKVRISRKEQEKLQQASNASQVEYFSVYHRDHIERILLKDIVHLDSSGSYTVINHILKHKILSTRSLKESEDCLPAEKFIRVHHGHIVNKDHVVKIIKHRHNSLVMSNGVEIPMAPNRKRTVLKALNI